MITEDDLFVEEDGVEYVYPQQSLLDEVEGKGRQPIPADVLAKLKALLAEKKK